MRSLEEWTKYLEQQEQSLQQTQKSEEEPSAEPEPPVQESARPAQTVVQPPARPAPTPREKPVPEKRQAETPVVSGHVDAEMIRTAARIRKSLPQQLQAFTEHEGEVAQTSYRTFKETREELLQRLLDPQLSLEDAARILNVCPTTVRRYTNKGILKHIRTPGNQRRFRLSDVLAFLESQM